MTPCKLDYGILDTHLAEIDGTAWKVYLAIWRHANDEGIAWPSQSTIAGKTGLGERAVRYALSRLEEGGLVTIERHPGRPMTYRLAPAPSCRPADEGAAPSCHPPRHEDAGLDGTPRHHDATHPGTTVPVPRHHGAAEVDTRTRNKKARAGRNGYTEDFETFWSVVAPHKKKSKREAFKRYQEAVKTLAGEHGDPKAFLLDRAKAYYSSPLGQTPFCNGPAPWLHQGGYDDDPAAWQRSENGNGQPKQPEKITYRA